MSRLLAHVSLQASDLAASRHFCETVLVPLGADAVLEVDGAIGFGRAGVPEFWIGAAVDPPGRETHIAFVAPDRAAVRRSTTRRSDWEWSRCTPRGSFRSTPRTTTARTFRDPDGNNAEAVCFTPE